MIVAEETALSSDPPRGLGLADTRASGDGAVATAATLISDGPRAVREALPAAIGRYQVIRSLGAGGMGEVVLARDPELDRHVAIKLLRAGRAREDAQVRLLREAQAMAKLSHPNVVQIHDVGVVGDRVFLAMELVEGETLAQWLGRRRGWREVVAMFVAAARGLAAAHAAGLVHRDFKPDNVLIGGDGRARVADFGLARGEREAGDARGEDYGARPLLLHTLTATGVVMGTPMYMSPEQHLGAPAGPASDVFSFSVALFEGLYGVRPFAGETLAELAGAVLASRIAAPPAGHGVPGWLEAVVRRGLEPEPERRWPDFPTLIAALDRDPARTRRRWFAGLGLGLAAAGLGATLQARNAEATCSGGASAIAAVWDADAAAAIGGRLAPEAAERVVGGLQAYADGWAEMHRSACMEHRRGESSAALLDAKMRCLEQRRTALASAVEVVGDATVDAPTVVARLPPLAGCADAEALSRAVARPADAAVAAAVVEVEGRLIRARVLADAGRPDQALAAISAARGEAEGLGYAPLIAAAWLAEGRAAIDAGAWQAASAALGRAFVRATAAGDDAVAAEARARQLFVDGLYGGDAGALAAGEHAEALVARLGDRRDLAALLANNLGVLRHAGGDPAAARGQFARALALDDPRIDPIDRAGYFKNAAMVAEDMSERTGLRDQAETLLAVELGPGHPTALWLTLARAREDDDVAAAAVRLAGVADRLTAVRAVHYDLCVEGRVALGHALDELGRAAEATEQLRAAEACLAGPLAPADVAPMAALRGLIAGLRGAIAGEPGVITGVAAAIEAYAPHMAVPGIAVRLADARVTMARLLVASGEDAAARAALERALVELEGVHDPGWLGPQLVARARVLLAGVLLRDPAGDATRARGLLDAAEAVYRAGGQASNLAAVAAVRAIAR